MAGITFLKHNERLNVKQKRKIHVPTERIITFKNVEAVLDTPKPARPKTTKIKKIKRISSLNSLDEDSSLVQLEAHGVSVN